MNLRFRHFGPKGQWSFTAIALVSFFWMAALWSAISWERYRVAQALSFLEAQPSPPGMMTGPSKDAPSQLLDPAAADGYVWVRHAQDAAEAGAWRWRYTQFDNAPYGREVHWNSGFLWALMGLGRLDQALTGAPLDAAIARAGSWFNPVFFLLLVAATTIWAWRRWDPLAAATVPLAMQSGVWFHAVFIYGYPDHHSLHNAAILGVLVCLITGNLGWIRQRPPFGHYGGRWFIAAGIITGLGMWVSAFVLLFALSGIALGACLAAVAVRRGELGWVCHAEWWRWWGYTAAGTSLFFYLLEYFPNHLGMRLEVNHPLHALFCAGLGEGVAWAVGLIAARRWPRLDGGTARAVAAAAACATLPLAIWMGGPRWYLPSDPFLFALHQFIQEFQPITRAFSGLTGRLIIEKAAAVVLVALLLCLPWFRALPTLRRVELGFLLGPTLALGAMAFYQARFTGTFAVALVAAAPAVVASLRAEGALGAWTRRCLVATVFIALAAFPFLVTTEVSKAAQGEIQIPRESIYALVARDIAAAIRKDVGAHGEVVLLAQPNLSVAAAYFGRFGAVGTLYWENRDGLRAAAELFSEYRGMDAALARLQARGVTHVALMSDSEFLLEYFLLTHPGARGREVENTMGVRIFSQGRFPVWARVLPMAMSPDFRKLGVQALVFAVDPGQTVADAAFNLGRNQLLNGYIKDAIASLQAAVDAGGGKEAEELLAAAINLQRQEDMEWKELERSVNAKPLAEQPPAWFESALALQANGKHRQAVAALEACLTAAPDNPMAMNNLAWLLATSRDDTIRKGERAQRLARKALEIFPEGYGIRGTLAAAEAELGRYDEAIRHLDDAIAAAKERGDERFVTESMKRRVRYLERAPWRE